jgi:hypothetical protein
MLIFVSHAHADADVVGAFVEMLTTAGAEPGDIYCTSISGHGVALGSAFDSDIHRRLTNARVVVILLSKAYFDSPYCMAELGGAWTLGTSRMRMLPLLLPTASAADVDGPIKQRISRSIRDRRALDEVWSVVSNLRDSPTQSRWGKARGAFLKWVERRYRGREELAKAREALERNVAFAQTLAALRVEKRGGSLSDAGAAGLNARNLPFFLEEEVGRPIRRGELSIEAAFDVFGDEVLLCYESRWLWADEETPRGGRHWRIFNELGAAFLSEGQQRHDRAIGVSSP